MSYSSILAVGDKQIWSKVNNQLGKMALPTLRAFDIKHTDCALLLSNVLRAEVWFWNG